LAEAYGWRSAFFVAGVPGLFVAAAALRIEEPTRSGAAPRPGAVSIWRELLAIPSFPWIVASGAVHNFNMYAISSFLSPLLMRRHGLGVGEAGLYSTLVYGLAGAVGLYAGGAASDRLQQRRRDGRLLLSAVSALASAPLALVALRRPAGDATGFAVLLALAVLLMYVYYGAIYAAIQDVVPSHLRGTALAFYFMAMYSLGAALGPLLTGSLSDTLAARAARAASSPDLEAFRPDGLLGALHVVPLLGVLLSAILFWAARATRRQPDARA
jgi:predicted MFS family arabinose efflux permease